MKRRQEVFSCRLLGMRLLLIVGAAHAFVALAGMAVAIRAHVDGFQLTDVLLAVMTAGVHAAVNGLIHGFIPPYLFFERPLGVILSKGSVQYTLKM